MRFDQFKTMRTQAALSGMGLECALFSDYYNVSYLTGYTSFLENGPSPFTRSMALAVFTPGKISLLAEDQAEPVIQEGWTADTEFVQGYGAHWPDAYPGSMLAALDKALSQDLPHTGKVGIEKTTLPVFVWERLLAQRPNIEWVDLPQSLMLEVRAVKSLAELDLLRACARLSDVGQEAVRRLVRGPGKSEIEVYSLAKAAMEASVKQRFALQCALHGGVNCGHAFDSDPSGYVLKQGDLVISDMVPYYNGYWGDSCSSFVVGGAEAVTSEQQRMQQIAKEAFFKGLEAVKPGLTGGELDAIVRGHIQRYGYDYPHHTGHGVGSSNHEQPRIIPGSPHVLEAGNVILLEPGIYIEGYGGVRQERMILVKEDGGEMLSQNPLELA